MTAAAKVIILLVTSKNHHSLAYLTRLVVLAKKI